MKEVETLAGYPSCHPTKPRQSSEWNSKQWPYIENLEQHSGIL